MDLQVTFSPGKRTENVYSETIYTVWVRTMLQTTRTVRSGAQGMTTVEALLQWVDATSKEWLARTVFVEQW